MGGAVGTIVGAVIGAEVTIPPPDVTKLKIVGPPPADATAASTGANQSPALAEWKSSSAAPKPPPPEEVTVAMP